MKQTAVEWLMEQLTKNYPLTKESAESIIEQAKAMEKEQIGNAYVYGSAYGIDQENGLSPNNYYKETFKQ